MELGSESDLPRSEQGSPDADGGHGRNSVFLNKALLDPARSCGPIVVRGMQARQLADILREAEKGYLPPAIQVYGPPGTGKTTTVVELAKAAAARFPGLRMVFVNLKECHSPFSAANQILIELTEAKESKDAGLDGVFAKIWASVREDKLLVLVLDEIDAIFGDPRYKPSDFLYRFLRSRETGEPPLVCLITITNRLMGIESLLESRVRSRMETRSLYFPPYREEELFALLQGRLGAFRPDGLAPGVLERCARHAAEEHGDARRVLDLLRVAGENADREGAACVEMAHVIRAMRAVDREGVGHVIRDLPDQETLVLVALSDVADELHAKMTRWKEGLEVEEDEPARWRTESLPENPAIPMSTVMDRYVHLGLEYGMDPRSRRRFSDFVQDLEMHGLIGSAVRSTGRYGHDKMIWIEGDPVHIGRYARYYLTLRHRPDLSSPIAPPPDDP